MVIWNMKPEEIKTVVWVGSTHEDLKKFPDAVKDKIGYALFRAQEGKKHHKAKPLIRNRLEREGVNEG